MRKIANFNAILRQPSTKCIETTFYCQQSQLKLDKQQKASAVENFLNRTQRKSQR